MRHHSWITAISSALLASACAASSPRTTTPLGETRASVASSSHRELRAAQYLSPARQPVTQRRELRAELGPEYARQQMLSDADPRVSQEGELPPSRDELGLLERQLAATRSEIATQTELATTGSQLDASTQALRDREVAIRAKIDVVYVQLDRAEHGKR